MCDISVGIGEGTVSFSVDSCEGVDKDGLLEWLLIMVLDEGGNEEEDLG